MKIVEFCKIILVNDFGIARNFLENLVSEGLQCLVVPAPCQQVRVEPCLHLFIRLPILTEKVHDSRAQAPALQLLFLELDLFLLQTFFFPALLLLLLLLDFMVQSTERFFHRLVARCLASLSNHGLVLCAIGSCLHLFYYAFDRVYSRLL